MVRDFDDEGSQFFREQQGSVLYGKQQALREHFQKLAGQQKVVCIHYQAKWDKRQGIAKHLDGMKKCLLEEAKKVIEEEAGKKEAKNWVEQEFLDADAFCTQATAYFGGREQILGKILSAAKEEGVNTICPYRRFWGFWVREKHVAGKGAREAGGNGLFYCLWARRKEQDVPGRAETVGLFCGKPDNARRWNMQNKR